MSGPKKKKKKKNHQKRGAARRGPSAPPSRPTILDTTPSMRLELDLVGFWHAGTGRGDGAVADAVVARDRSGLPYLPGRTVKGLVREAVRLGVEAGMDGLTEDVETALFGSRPPRDLNADSRVSALERARYGSHAGKLAVTSARLGATRDAQARWQAWAAGRRDDAVLQGLFATLSSTRLDERGVAADHTLRTVEVTVPVTLHAWLRVASGKPGVPWTALDKAVRLFLRGLGSGRHRGLGRVQARLHKEDTCR